MHKGNTNVAFGLGFFCGIIAVCVLFGVITVAQIAGTINGARDVVQECGWTGTVNTPTERECVNEFCNADIYCRGGSACLRHYKEQCDCCVAKYGRQVRE